MVIGFFLALIDAKDTSNKPEPSKGVKTMVDIIYDNWGGKDGLEIALGGEAWPGTGDTSDDPRTWSKRVLRDLKKLSNTTKGNPKEARGALKAAMMIRQGDKADDGHLVRHMLGRDANNARLNIESEREVNRILKRKRGRT